MLFLEQALLLFFLYSYWEYVIVSEKKSIPNILLENHELERFQFYLKWTSCWHTHSGTF